MVDTVIKNCNIVSPEGIVEGTIGIEGEKIVSISKEAPPAKRVIDAEKKYVMPGAIDAHCHVGWPDWPIDEAYRKDSEAAAMGGVSTIIDRVTLPPGSLLEQIFGPGNRRDTLENNSYVDVALQACLFTDEHIEEVPDLGKEGIVGMKFYIPYRGPEAVPPMVGIDDGLIYMGFKKIAECGLPVHAQIHAENIEIFYKFKQKFLAEKNEFYWADTRPNFCEIEPLYRCGYFAKITGCPVYVVHMSVKEGPGVIAQLRGHGVNIVAETCPQYLVCTTENVDRILSKVNPPIRTEEDNKGLWEGIRNGLITNLGSDHAPCATSHKEEFWSAVVGMAGIETMLPIMLSEGVNKGRITFEKLVEIISYNNAKQFALLPRKGIIAVGSDADLVIVDLEKKVKVEVSKLHYISDFTPFEGWEITGWPVLTMVRGKVVMEDGKLFGEAGHGTFVPAKAR